MSYAKTSVQNNVRSTSARLIGSLSELLGTGVSQIILEFKIEVCA